MKAVLVSAAIVLGTHAGLAQPARTTEPIPGPTWPPSELQHVGYQCEVGGELVNLTIDYRNMTVHESLADKARPQMTGKSKGPPRKAEMSNRFAIAYDDQDGKRVFLDLKGGHQSGKILRGNQSGTCRLFD